MPTGNLQPPTNDEGPVDNQATVGQSITDAVRPSRPLARAEMASAAATRPRFALPALCVTQIIGWGSMYYAFPVMLPAITADTGWNAAMATGAFSAGLILSAGAGIPIGHLIDRTGPRRVMTAGSVLGALALTLIATAPSLIVFTLGWLLAGIAMAATFYQPAFAAITRWYGHQRIRALTILTLAGGLASTVFAPLTALLTETYGWRGTGLALAALLLLTAAPLHAAALRGPWPDPDVGQQPASFEPSSQVRTSTITTSRDFLALAVSLTLSGFSMYAVIFGLIPLLTERGATTTQAAWALGLGGLGQTLGRLFYGSLARRTNPRGRTAGLILAGGVVAALFAAVPGPLWVLTGISMVAGMVRGNLTLLQATAITDRWGTHAYGRLTATLAAPVTIASALSPWAVAALVIPLGGYTDVFWILAATSTIGALTATLPGRGHRDAE
jgi:MFS family permease